MATTVRDSGGDGATARAAPGAPRAGAETSLTALVVTIFRSARDVLGHTFEIAALESRLAGVTLVAMVGIALGVLILVLSAWGLLLAAAVYGLMEAGLEPAPALLLAVAANLVTAGVLVVIFLRLTQRLKFSATRRVLEKMGSNS